MSGGQNKRFWKEVRVEPSGTGWAVQLDTRALRTPAKAALILPNRALADAVAQEWRAQGDVVDPLSMPFTRSANAAIDKVAPGRQAVADMLAAYGETDLLCYRADSPQALRARQSQAWDPLLDWAESSLQARLKTGTGVMFVAQDAQALSNLRRPVDALDPFTLTGFHDLVCLSGSLIIGLAALSSDHQIADLWERARIDEQWQQEQWGEDEEATTLEENRLAAFHHAARFCELARKTA